MSSGRTRNKRTDSSPLDPSGRTRLLRDGATSQHPPSPPPPRSHSRINSLSTGDVNENVPMLLVSEPMVYVVIPEIFLPSRLKVLADITQVREFSFHGRDMRTLINVKS